MVDIQLSNVVRFILCVERWWKKSRRKTPPLPFSASWGLTFMLRENNKSKYGCNAMLLQIDRQTPTDK